MGWAQQQAAIGRSQEEIEQKLYTHYNGMLSRLESEQMRNEDYDADNTPYMLVSNTTSSEQKSAKGPGKKRTKESVATRKSDRNT